MLEEGFMPLALSCLPLAPEPTRARLGRRTGYYRQSNYCRRLDNAGRDLDIFVAGNYPGQKYLITGKKGCMHPSSRAGWLAGMSPVETMSSAVFSGR